MGATHAVLERKCSDSIVLTGCSRPIEILSLQAACKLHLPPQELSFRRFVVIRRDKAAVDFADLLYRV